MKSAGIVAVVAWKELPTNLALVRGRRRLGIQAELLAPAAARRRLGPGDVALVRLDVTPGLDGVEPGLADGQASRGLELVVCRDGQPQTAQFRRNHLEVGTTARRGAARRELATRHPIALELDRLLVSRTPLQFEYVPRMEAILLGPEHLTLPLVQRGLRAADALKQREPAR